MPRRPLQLIDEARQIGPLAFSSRLLYLAESHGHVAPDGSVNEETLAFFLERLESDWGGMSLGRVRLGAGDEALAPSEPSFSELSLENEAQREALRRLLDALRQRSPELRLGVELVPAQQGEAALLAPLSLDWVSFLLPSLEAALDVSALGSLREDQGRWLRVRLRPDLSNAQIGQWRAKIASLSSHFDLLHVSLDPGHAASTIGGSERASAKLGAIARALVEGTELSLLVSGRIKHAEDAERVLRFHGADLAGLSRASLAEPRVLTIDRAGGTSLHCTGCMACMPGQARFDDARCALRFAPHLYAALDAAPPEHLLVAGASFAGLSLAHQAALRGAQVEVFPLGGPTGGAMRLRGRVPRQAESAEAALQMLSQCRAAGVFIHPAGSLAQELEQAMRPESTLVVSLMRDHLATIDERLPAAWQSHGLERLDPLVMLDTSVTDRRPFFVFGDTLLAVECALQLEMQDLQVCLIGDAIAADTHPLLRQFYEARVAERQLLVVKPSQVRAAPGDEVMLQVEGGFQGARLVWAADAGVEGRLERELRARFPEALVLPDVYEPLAQRATLQGFFWSRGER